MTDTQTGAPEVVQKTRDEDGEGGWWVSALWVIGTLEGK